MHPSKTLLACFLMTASTIATAKDNRQTLTLSEAQRGHVYAEMQALLSGTQGILAALARDDMAAVAKQALPLGMGMNHKAEDHLHGVLPKDFITRGMAVHQAFDQIAADATAKKDPKLTLRQLSETLGQCVACHATYQIRPTARSEKPAPTQPSDHDHHH